MKSIVSDLQSEALNRSIPITDLLRKSLVVAKKLQLTDFEAWVRNELHGFEKIDVDTVPAYRRVRGTPEVLNPYHGWQPIMFENDETLDVVSNRVILQPISEIEHLLEKKESGGSFQIQYPGSVAQELMEAIGLNLQPVLKVQASSLVRIVDSVRNVILDWALKLEADGIVGEGVSFSKEELTRASNYNYTVNNFHGDLVNSQVQQSSHGSSQTLNNSIDIESIRKLVDSAATEVSKLNLSEEAKSDIDAEISTIRSQIGSSKPKSIVLNESLKSLREFLVGAGANLGAAAIQAYLASHGMFPK